MSMKHLLIKILAFTLLTLSAMSHAFPPKPSACPSAALIKAGGLAYAEFDEGSYIALQISQYGTSKLWGFGIGDIQASSPEQALSIGYQALASLNGSPTPLPIQSENLWACLYSTNSGHLAAAFTPVPMGAKVKKSIMLNAR
jgi:Domain of unknown function (DUF4949)